VQCVFVHGWGMNSAVWDSLINKLPDYFEPVCIDFPGHGQFNQLGFESLQNLVDHLLQQSASTLSGPAIWVGWSLGALSVLEFSFSGLKTFALNTMQKSDGSEQSKADIALAFEEAVVDTLMIKSRRAIRETGIKTLVIAGGVGANQRLRRELSSMAEKEGGQLYYPRVEFCTDNGAMIAYAGCLRLQAGQTEDIKINVRARWPMEELVSL